MYTTDNFHRGLLLSGFSEIWDIFLSKKKIKVKANDSNNVPENEFLRKIILKKYTYH